MQNRVDKKSGFTIIELLVVVGIVVLLAGLLLPMLYKTYRSAGKSRLAADLNTIGVALDAYKSDFGDYPRVPAPGTGFAILGKALVGPADAVVDNMPIPSSPFRAGTMYFTGTGSLAVQSVAVRDTQSAGGSLPDWVAFPFADGADGPGFRIRAQGKITNPYLQPGKFKQQGVAILDLYGNPIMYFPASPVKLNLQLAGARYVSSVAMVGTLPATERTMFNFDDNGTLAFSMCPDPATSSPSKALAGMQALMGLRSPQLATAGTSNGLLKQGGTPVSVPFILWSAGADNIFGPNQDILGMNGDAGLIDKAVRKCDDVANIPLPQ